MLTHCTNINIYKRSEGVALPEVNKALKTIPGIELDGDGPAWEFEHAGSGFAGLRAGNRGRLEIDTYSWPIRVKVKYEQSLFGKVCLWTGVALLPLLVAVLLYWDSLMLGGHWYLIIPTVVIPVVAIVAFYTDVKDVNAQIRKRIKRLGEA